MKKALLLAVLVFNLCPVEARAVEVAGVTVPETVSFESSGDKLVLNGAGVRRAFLMDVYVGALYLPTRLHDIDSVLALSGAKRLTLSFLRDITAGRVVEALRRGLAANHTAEEFEYLNDRLAPLAGKLCNLHRGDRLRIDYVPGAGTQVWLNGEMLCKVEGEEFYKALLRVWLGPEVEDADLRRAMLGS